MASRPDRWSKAVKEGQDAISEAQAAMAKVQEKMEALEELRSEYEEWRDNTPDSLQQSPTYEKLDAVADLDFQWDAESDSLSDAEEKFGEAENADLPRGFGND